MATGSIKTPAILQQSGIGPTSVLESAGVTQVVNLPIGMNLIDQTTTTTDWSFDVKRGGGQPITFPRFQVCRVGSFKCRGLDVSSGIDIMQDLFNATEANSMSSMLQNDLGAYAQAAVDAGASSSASGLQAVLEIQRGWILNESAGISENFDYSFGMLVLSITRICQ